MVEEEGVMRAKLWALGGCLLFSASFVFLSLLCCVVGQEGVMRAKLWALGGCHSLSPLTWMSLSGWGEGWRVRERDLFDGEKWGSALWVVGGSCVLLAAGGSRHAGLAHGAQQPTSGCRLFFRGGSG